MKQSTLYNIKKQIKPLIKLVEAYNKMNTIKEDLLTAITVALCNVSMIWDNCHGYTLEEDIRRMDTTVTWLRAIKAYERDYHFVVYIIEEFLMIHDGNAMSEEYA